MQAHTKTGVLLVNLGTPDSPKPRHVGKYLAQFLNDRRVIDIPTIPRFILVNFIIIPLRVFRSAGLYKRLWTKDGSPLIYHTQNLANKVQSKLGDQYLVKMAMRYQNPSIQLGIDELLKNGVNKIVVLPLYPQYASSTTGSTMEEVYRIVKNKNDIPEIVNIGPFYQFPSYIDALKSTASTINHSEYDHVLFSFHGLPVRHLERGHEKGFDCENCNCRKNFQKEHFYCYQNACFETANQLANELDIPKERYTVVFQSRLGKRWMQPYAEPFVAELPARGIKKVLVFSPAFVSDCLETTIEIDFEYKELFLEKGGEKLTLVPSLNDSDKWVQAVVALIQQKE